MELVISANYTHVIVLEQGFENDFKLFVAKFQIQILIFSYNFFLQNAYTYHVFIGYWTSFDICKS